MSEPTSLPAESLIRLQVALEYELDQNDRLAPFPGSEEQARYIVYRHPGGWLAFQRHDLPPSLGERLASLSPESAAMHPEAVQALLALGQPPAAWGHYLAYYFPAAPAILASPPIEHQGNQFAVRQAGQRVAWAWSVRENEGCAEAAVETLPEFRRRGFARQVTAAWAGAIIESGRVAFFSHKTSNLASAGLARSLGAEYFADCLAFE